MKLRCRPGDLAVLIKGQNIGVLVDVLNLNDDEIGFWDVIPHSACRGHDRDVSAGEICLAHDSKLRPLRDSDGEDETFTWAGKPEEVKV